MKSPIDTVNIWYSPQIGKWTVCALVVTQLKVKGKFERGWAASDCEREPDGLRREKSTHDTFDAALTHVTTHYQDWRNSPLQS